MIFVHFRMKQLIFQANVQRYIEITGRSICMRNFEQFWLSRSKEIFRETFSVRFVLQILIFASPRVLATERSYKPSKTHATFTLELDYIYFHSATASPVILDLNFDYNLRLNYLKHFSTNTHNLLTTFCLSTAITTEETSILFALKANKSRRRSSAVSESACF